MRTPPGPPAWRLRHSAARMIALTTIIGGIVGLKLASPP